MVVPGLLTVRKVLSSSHALAELKKLHRDHGLVPFAYGNFPCLCIARGGENSIRRAKFLRALRVCAHVKPILLCYLW
ncbi:hypothetical protein HOLleu_13757 [Holothuria leucospilota]|uniref:Uncharacterized protein n=1 Tax=Holothuria leucospilota TaxID=206669 RepID=A0A9Q1C6Q8_HOLLE|nr:hypothetical protein HOLleu_13757 [Holothuria leucospilota]